MTKSILLLIAIAFFGCKPSTHERREAKIAELKEQVTLEQAKYLARQSFRYGYYNGATRALIGKDATETFQGDSITFERLILNLLNHPESQFNSDQ